MVPARLHAKKRSRAFLHTLPCFFPLQACAYGILFRIAVADRYFNDLLLAVPHNAQAYFIANLRFLDCFTDFRRRLHFRAVQFDDDVVRTNPCAEGRALTLDLRDDCAFVIFKLQLGNPFLVDILHGNAHIRSRLFRNFYIVLQVVKNRRDCARRNRKADALRLCANRRIDADHFTVQVKQRAAGIPRVNRRVGLQQMLVIARAVLIRDADRTLFRAQDANGDRMIKAVRVADRHDPIAYVQIVRAAERQNREFFAVFRRYFQRGEVEIVAVAEQFGFERLLVTLHVYPNFVRAFDDVLVSQNISGFLEDKTGSHPAGLQLSGIVLLSVRPEVVAEKLTEERIVEERAAASRRALRLHLRLDLHDRRARLFDDSRDVVRTGHIERGRLHPAIVRGACRRRACRARTVTGHHALRAGEQVHAVRGKHQRADDQHTRHERDEQAPETAVLLRRLAELPLTGRRLLSALVCIIRTNRFGRRHFDWSGTDAVAGH